MTLIEEVEEIVSRVDPNQKPGETSFSAISLILLMALIKNDCDHFDLEVARRLTNYSEGLCGQLLANMQIGGVLQENGLLQDFISDEILNDREGTNTTLFIMVNVAEGKMSCDPDKQTYRLTEAGKIDIEKRLGIA